MLTETLAGLRRVRTEWKMLALNMLASVHIAVFAFWGHRRASQSTNPFKRRPITRLTVRKHHLLISFIVIRRFACPTGQHTRVSNAHWAHRKRKAIGSSRLIVGKFRIDSNRQRNINSTVPSLQRKINWAFERTWTLFWILKRIP